MLEDNYYGSESDHNADEVVEPISSIHDAENSGSYYSPRNGGAVPPTGATPYGGIGPQPTPPKRSSHKGLKALAIFAGIAFLSYASIQCYQFATGTSSLKAFFGRDSSIAEESTVSQQTTAKNENSKQSTTTSAESHAAISQSWIDLAARADALPIPQIVDKVMPCTVGVSSTFVWKSTFADPWGFSGGQNYEQNATGTGTGIILSEDGYVITNAHVIYQSNYGGAASEIQVVLNGDYYDGETQLTAKLVGYDVEEDIAVLKVDTDQTLSAAEFGDSSDLRVGELVIAIGNPLGLDLFGSVTTGIVSALDRQVTINEVTMSLIQTDAAINSGNSGGPLINSYGQVVGINSAKMGSSYSETTVEGLGFAIPMSHAKKVVDDLINFGYVRGKPVIGVSGRDVSESVSQAYGLPIGIYVTEVTSGGAADLAGIQEGDIIIAVNGKTVSTYEELNNAKNAFAAGDTITLTVTRKSVDHDYSVILQEKKPDVAH